MCSQTPLGQRVRELPSFFPKKREKNAHFFLLSFLDRRGRPLPRMPWGIRFCQTSSTDPKWTGKSHIIMGREEAKLVRTESNSHLVQGFLTPLASGKEEIRGRAKGTFPRKRPSLVEKKRKRRSKTGFLAFPFLPPPLFFSVQAHGREGIKVGGGTVSHSFAPQIVSTLGGGQGENTIETVVREESRHREKKGGSQVTARARERERRRYSM